MLFLSKLYLKAVGVLALGLLASARPVLEKRASRTSPPSGAVVVRPSNPGSGEFTSIQAAIKSLPNDSSSRTIFIYPGTYTEQVIITRPGPLTIYGSTTDTTTYTKNTVTITHSQSAADSNGSDNASATLQVTKDNFTIYNVNLKNTYGQGSQALAAFANGSKQGYYGVSFTGFQASRLVDTLRAEKGVQFYANSFIEGAVDFIFGEHAHAFFQGVTISSTSKGCITADGPSSSTDGIYVINKSNIVLSPNAASGTSGGVYLGRPWSDTARVVYTNSVLGAHINPAGWSAWSAATPNTDHVLFGEFGNTGPGASGTRASFATKLTSTAGYTISDILGSDYATWTDSSFV